MAWFVTDNLRGCQAGAQQPSSVVQPRAVSAARSVVVADGRRGRGMRAERFVDVNKLNKSQKTRRISCFDAAAERAEARGATTPD